MQASLCTALHEWMLLITSVNQISASDYAGITCARAKQASSSIDLLERHLVGSADMPEA